MAGISVVDFQSCGLHGPAIVKHGDGYSAEVRSVVDQVGQALEECGFVYLTNHGVEDELVNEVTRISNQFFELPVERKERYKRRKEVGNDGWVSMEMEHIDPSKPGDLKEAYNFWPISKTMAWPNAQDSDVPHFLDVNTKFFNACAALTLGVLKVMGIALLPENDDYFVNSHQYMGDTKFNHTALRSLYYPKLTQEPLEGQLRLGEHSDYGSITLLFQDNIGGLEIKKSGVYIPATPVQGGVLVNTGDLMERWTADQILATKHRVRIPKEEYKLQQVRRSTVLFAHPDDDCLIKCIDSSDKYPEITSLQYLLDKLNASYNY